MIKEKWKRKAKRPIVSQSEGFLNDGRNEFGGGEDALLGLLLQLSLELSQTVVPDHFQDEVSLRIVLNADQKQRERKCGSRVIIQSRHFNIQIYI